MRDAGATAGFIWSRMNDNHPFTVASSRFGKYYTFFSIAQRIESSQASEILFLKPARFSPSGSLETSPNLTQPDQQPDGAIAARAAQLLTARNQLLAPKAILIRSDMHNTTTNKGRHVIDTKGWHGTFAFKTSDQLQREYHVASHGYTNDKEDFVLKEATHTREKADNIRRGGPNSEKVVWGNQDFYCEKATRGAP
ncbi:hypothetical protein N7527_005387 [Penicillium freii]|nr:hypothetical protein N7527_005387 [Penicillium freii]